ncbi:hydroxyproline dehydrogenase [Polypterus senegalus]|uniref:hydroxyproline dehydrogenase n=1 Tax=Polypterus senegalus TaxID=55291 RepID=UPI001962F396|nr:hydroxyproline dehydrogenase [Polypterus senegalus]
MHLLSVSSWRLLSSRLAPLCLRTLSGEAAVSISFEDGHAFRLKQTREILRALAVFRMCSFPFLVNNSMKLMEVSRLLLRQRLFALLMKSTAYGQFVAGETMPEIRFTMEKLSMMGMRPMLAVPIEEDLGEMKTGEPWYNQNLETMLECVKISHSGSKVTYPMMQLKVTALLSAELCTKITMLLTDSQLREKHFGLDCIVRALEGQDVNFPSLSEGETQHFLCAMRRLNRVGEYAREHKVRVLVDAEYTYINPTLTLVTLAMMKKFNQSEPWIWNTYQCYLKDSFSLLSQDLDLAAREGFAFGVKLVRGAYMDKERKLAKEQGYPDPVHKSWEDTNRSYHKSLNRMLEMAAQDRKRYNLIVATHNEESVKHAIDRMKALGISKDAGSVCFGQLLGMCDHVSLTLGQHGFAIYKSIPYGPINDVLPYLVRRAQENRTVLQGIRKERDLLRRELWRRLLRRT